MLDKTIFALEVQFKALTDPLYEVLFFFFNDTATTEIYTLSLHDALPISGDFCFGRKLFLPRAASRRDIRMADRKSTRLNSSHLVISYAVFCLKKKRSSFASPMSVSRCSIRCVSSYASFISSRSCLTPRSQ